MSTRHLLLTLDGVDRLNGRLARGRPETDLRQRAAAARTPALGTVPTTLGSGIAIIPISGILVDETMSYDWWWSGDTGYGEIRQALDAAVADPAVKAILLNVNSPGGFASGCADLAEAVYRASLRGGGQKPVWAWAESGYSAAYWIASAADRVMVAEAGGLGSIGVILTHTDLSQALQKSGITVTHIFCGKYKAVGSPYKPLSDDDKAVLQGEEDAVYARFCAVVGRHRGVAGLDEAAARATEAACWIGSDALAVHLADAVGCRDDALAGLAALITPPPVWPGWSAAQHPSQTERINAMTTSTAATPPAGGPAPANTTTQAPPSEAVAAQLRAEGAAAERARVAAILRSEAAKGRMETALSFALDTDMAAETAVKVLATVPAAAPPAPAPKLTDPRSPLDRHMEKAPNPTVGADADKPDAAAGLDPSAIYSRLNAAGRKG